jgi:general stress protein 26
MILMRFLRGIASVVDKQMRMENLWNDTDEVFTWYCIGGR